jgi:aspartate-semialdehyde dehydrogenase
MPETTRSPLIVAVVGATGVVGRTMIQVLNEREFPVGELRLLASGRSAGRTIAIDGQTHQIGEAVGEAFDGFDIALFSAGADISLELAPQAVTRGATVIDNSSAWRMDPSIPLVVSEVNPDDLEGHPGIIANPNCSTMQLVPVLMAIRDSVGIERVVVDTYQAVSGTGADAIAEFRARSGPRRRRAEAGLGVPPPDRLQRAAPGRRVPRQRLHQGGVEGRHREPQDPAPAGPANLVHGRPRAGLRRPLRGGPRRDARAADARPGPRALRPCAGRRCPGRPVDLDYPLATDAAGNDEIYVGRVRADESIPDGRGLAFWVVSDNLRKGAATNAVQIAEALVARGWVTAAAVRGASPYRVAEAEPAAAGGSA